MRIVKQLKDLVLGRLTSKYEQKFALEWGVTAAITALILVLFISWPFFDSLGNHF